MEGRNLRVHRRGREIGKQFTNFQQNFVGAGGFQAGI